MILDTPPPINHNSIAAMNRQRSPQRQRQQETQQQQQQQETRLQQQPTQRNRPSMVKGGSCSSNTTGTSSSSMLSSLSSNRSITATLLPSVPASPTTVPDVNTEEDNNNNNNNNNDHQVHAAAPTTSKAARLFLRSSGSGSTTTTTTTTTTATQKKKNKKAKKNKKNKKSRGADFNNNEERRSRSPDEQQQQQQRPNLIRSDSNSTRRLVVVSSQRESSLRAAEFCWDVSLSLAPPAPAVEPSLPPRRASTGAVPPSVVATRRRPTYHSDDTSSNLLSPSGHPAAQNNNEASTEASALTSMPLTHSSSSSPSPSRRPVQRSVSANATLSSLPTSSLLVSVGDGRAGTTRDSTSSTSAAAAAAAASRVPPPNNMMAFQSSSSCIHDEDADEFDYEGDHDDDFDDTTITNNLGIFPAHDRLMRGVQRSDHSTPPSLSSFSPPNYSEVAAAALLLVNADESSSCAFRTTVGRLDSLPEDCSVNIDKEEEEEKEEISSYPWRRRKSEDGWSSSSGGGSIMDPVDEHVGLTGFGGGGGGISLIPPFMPSLARSSTSSSGSTVLRSNRRIRSELSDDDEQQQQQQRASSEGRPPHRSASDTKLRALQREKRPSSTVDSTSPPRNSLSQRIWSRLAGTSTASSNTEGSGNSNDNQTSSQSSVRSGSIGSKSTLRSYGNKNNMISQSGVPMNSNKDDSGERGLQGSTNTPPRKQSQTRRTKSPKIPHTRSCDGLEHYMRGPPLQDDKVVRPLKPALKRSTSSSSAAQHHPASAVPYYNTNHNSCNNISVAEEMTPQQLLQILSDEQVQALKSKLGHDNALALLCSQNSPLRSNKDNPELILSPNGRTVVGLGLADDAGSSGGAASNRQILNASLEEVSVLREVAGASADRGERGSSHSHRSPRRGKRRQIQQQLAREAEEGVRGAPPRTTSSKSLPIMRQNYPRTSSSRSNESSISSGSQHRQPSVRSASAMARRSSNESRSTISRTQSDVGAGHLTAVDAEEPYRPTPRRMGMLPPVTGDGIIKTKAAKISVKKNKKESTPGPLVGLRGLLGKRGEKK